MTDSPFKIRRLGESTVLFYDPGVGKIAIGFLLKDLVSEAWSVKADTIALPVACMANTLFDLKTGAAESLVRTLANYRITIAFVGTLPRELDGSSDIEAFIQASNKGRSAWFVADSAALERKLSGQP